VSEVSTVFKDSIVSFGYLTRLENPLHNVRDGMIFVSEIQRVFVLNSFVQTKTPEDALCPWPLVLGVMQVFDVIRAENRNVSRSLGKAEEPVLVCPNDNVAMGGLLGAKNCSCHSICQRSLEVVNVIDKFLSCFPCAIPFLKEQISLTFSK